MTCLGETHASRRDNQSYSRWANVVIFPIKTSDSFPFYSARVQTEEPVRSTLKFERTELAGLVVLFVGMILLALTFFSAFGFLSGSISILASADLTELFGNAMGPLIEAIIRILYLGIMGWIGSILTIRGVQLLKREKEAAPPQVQVKPEPKQSTNTTAQAKTEPKTDVKESKKIEPTSTTPVPEPPKELEKEVQAK